jgi:hypothetical protein
MVSSIKHASAIGILLLSFASFATASIEGPITDYIHGADTIYLVRADVAKDVGSYPYKGDVKFVVTEVLRGQPTESLRLTPGIIDLSEGPEFVILSSDSSRHGRRGNFVGSLFKGDVGWLDAPIIHQGGKTYVFLGFKYAKPITQHDTVINGQTYVPLDYIKELIKADAGK